ncbi:MAG: T9SS type A sorting domain-containing protein [Bacteroidetes bacterium]|nr:T9SS type A sorting domain-containing protein [Bacteroidota bacterium]MBU1114566.1 T9SS type A sorting domain-containing protein [Bacteroidota bacterium]MBU1800247.1 T9SS type A sorting domain-containing protein [Bacteroidota bacterium]
MKNITLFFILLLSSVMIAQTYSSNGIINPILSDSSDLPTGIWSAGSTGGPVTFGTNFENNIYFTQGTYFYKAEEGTKNIEILEQNFLPNTAKSFKINGDNLYMIFDENSSYKNKISKSTMSNLSSSSATEYGEITNGINKFEEVNGYVYLAHNKNGILSDKIVGKDFLNNIEASSLYTKDFRDFVANENYIYLIADNGTTTRTIEIVDFSNKSNVTKVGSIVVASAVSLDYSDGYLYVACDDNQGFQVIDVSNPTNPTNVGNYNGGNESYLKLVVEGTKAYLVGYVTLVVLDISNPAVPKYLNYKWLSDLGIGATVQLTDVANGKIYYVDNGHFGIIETDGGISLGQKYLSPTTVEKVVSDGNNLVIYDNSNFYFGSLVDNKLSPDIYDELSPSIFPEDFTIDGDYFYLSDYNNLYIHQVSNLSSTPISTYPYSGQYEAFKVDGNLAVVGGFVPSFENYFEIIDLTDRSNPTKVFSGTNLTNGTINSIEFSSDKNILYLTSEGGGKVWFTIYDITDKSTPSKISETQIEVGANTKMGLSDSTVIFSINKSNISYETHLIAYNISNPINPQLLDDILVSFNEYNDMLFLEDLVLINVPHDQKLYTYTFVNSTGVFVAGEVLDIGSELENMSGFIDHTVPAKTFKKANNLLGDEYDYGYVYASEKSEGYEIIYFEKKKKVVTNVTLLTSVKPSEAADDGCKVSPTGGVYKKGTNIQMSATAVEGWAWSHWSGDLSGSANPSNLKMDGNKSVTGNFKPILELSFGSDFARMIGPPKNDEKMYIGKASLTAYGVDWELKHLDFLVTTKVKAEYAGAFIVYDGKTVQGTIHKDDNGYMTGLNFVTPKIIPELTTLTLELYFMFDFPPNEKGSLAPLDEIKRIGVSIHRTQVFCDPINGIEGIKEPQETFNSKIHTIGWIWNWSLSPAVPFETIQKANDDPKTLDGHEITIYEGYYKYDYITNITKSLSIKPHGIGGDIYIEGNDDATFNITANDVTITGFNISNIKEGSDGLSSSYRNVIESEFSSDKITIENNKILCNKFQNGINIKGAIPRTDYGYSYTLSKNTFLQVSTDGNACGVRILNGHNYDIRENNFESLNKGISITNCNNGNISSNSFLLVSTLINNQSSTETRFEFNDIQNLSDETSTIYLLNSSHKCEILHNSIKEHDFRVLAVESNDLNFFSNKVEGTNKIELELEDTHRATIKGQNNMILKIFSEKGLYSTGHNIHGNDNCKYITLKKVANSKIISNTIKDNEQYLSINPIKIESCSDISLEENRIYSSNVSGIYAIYSEGIKIKNLNYFYINAPAIEIISSRGEAINTIRQNKIFSNKENTGILVSFNYCDIGIIGNDIYDAKIGINVHNSSGGNIEFNNLLRNGTAILTKNVDDFIISRNNIEESTDDFTGIHLESTNAIIEGNNLLKNNGAAVGLFNNSIAQIRENNFIDNPNLAVFSDNPNAIVNVDDNYWGSTDEPSSDIFEGNIEYNNWLKAPISLIVNVSEDSVKTALGKTDSVSIAINNFVVDNDNVEIKIVDEKGWLINGGTQTINLNDSSFTFYKLIYEVPSDAGNSFNNKVTISAASLTNTEMTAVDSFYILNYTPELAAITVSPDSISVGLGDSLQFNVYGFDQYKIEFDGEAKYNWSSSSGSIDSAGFFIADSVQGVVTITATETNSNISATASINIQPHINLAETITIYPDSVVIPINGTIQFYAEGKDASGFAVEFNKQWKAVGGTIDSAGYFTAGEMAGEYYVTVKDVISGAEANAKVIVGTPTSVETERIVPKEYSLNQNYPNPFNPSTTISYGLPFESKVKVEIFNILGQRVDVITNRIESAGLHSILWDASHLSSGVYIIRINATAISNNINFSKSIKIILMK